MTSNPTPPTPLPQSIRKSRSIFQPHRPPAAAIDRYGFWCASLRSSGSSLRALYCSGTRWAAGERNARTTSGSCRPYFAIFSLASLTRVRYMFGSRSDGSPLPHHLEQHLNLRYPNVLRSLLLYCSTVYHSTLSQRPRGVGWDILGQIGATSEGVRPQLQT